MSEPNYSLLFNISNSNTTTIISSPETPSTTIVSSSASSTTSLGRGAKAGISVRVALSILLITTLISIAIYFYRRYRTSIKSDRDPILNKLELNSIDRDEERRR
jgi:hypothetical protein